MSAGPAEFADDLAEHFAGATVRKHGADRKNQLVLVDAGAHGPIDLLETNEEIDDLRCQFRLWQFIDPADHQPIVNEGALQRLQDALEITLRQAGVADAREQVLVRQRVEIEERAVVNRARLAWVAT